MFLDLKSWKKKKKPRVYIDPIFMSINSLILEFANFF
jgi:hypothetical protein